MTYYPRLSFWVMLIFSVVLLAIAGIQYAIFSGNEDYKVLEEVTCTETNWTGGVMFVQCGNEEVDVHEAEIQVEFLRKDRPICYKVEGQTFHNKEWKCGDLDQDRLVSE